MVASSNNAPVNAVACPGEAGAPVALSAATVVRVAVVDAVVTDWSNMFVPDPSEAALATGAGDALTATVTITAALEDAASGGP
jgi:hypothetical protein